MESNNNTTERDQEVFKDSFKNARNTIPDRGFSTTIYKEFPDCHGLAHHNLWFNGRDTGKRLIEYKDRFVCTTSRQYEVLPNEKVVEIMEEVLMDNPSWGLTPDQTHSEGNWHVRDGNVVMSNESKFSPTGTSMMARYRFADNIDPTGDGRELHLGLCVGNSIDLTRGFSIIPYHYREGCMNSIYHVRAASLHEEGTITWNKVGDVNHDGLGVKGIDLEVGAQNLQNQIDDLQNTAEQIKRNYRSVRHTKEMDKDFIIEQIQPAIEVVNTLGQRYKELSQLKISDIMAQRIADSTLPKSVVLDDLEGINIYPEMKDKEPTGRMLFDITDKDMTNWELYNQVTDKLSHGNLNFNSTLKHMGTLDTIFQVWN